MKNKDKQKYVSPIIEIHILNQEFSLLAGSGGNAGGLETGILPLSDEESIEEDPIDEP